MSIRLNPRSSLIPDPLISSHHGVRRLPRRGLPVSPRQVPHHAGRRSPRRRLSQSFVAGCAPRRAPPRASPPPPDVRCQVLRPAPALHRRIPVQRLPAPRRWICAVKSPSARHRSRIPAPRQSSPAGCGPAWNTPTQQTSRSAEPSCSSVQRPSPKCRLFRSAHPPIASFHRGLTRGVHDILFIYLCGLGKRD